MEITFNISQKFWSDSFIESLVMYKVLTNFVGK